jgi:hypothetical protein
MPGGWERLDTLSRSSFSQLTSPQSTTASTTMYFQSVFHSYHKGSHHSRNPIAQAHVEAIGPAAFSLINSLPVFIVRGLLCFEMVKISPSAMVGLLLVILILSPGLLQILGEAITLYQASHMNEDSLEGSNQVK